MGKTVVCISLILENPLPVAQQSKWDHSTIWQLARLKEKWGDFAYTESDNREKAERLTAKFAVQKLALKTTLVLTRNSLLGQWKDELRKYAPQLKVITYHGSSKERRDLEKGVTDLTKVDVVLGTPTTSLPCWLRTVASFHRVIVDESHEGVRPASQYRCGLRWAVTGTPVTKDFTELKAQATFLGHPHPLATGQRSPAFGGPPQGGLDFARITDSLSRATSRRDIATQQKNFADLITALQMVMIRHTKSQRIAGDVALALPELASEAMWLTMKPEEMTSYRSAKQLDESKARFRSAKRSGTQAWNCAMVISNQVAACSQADGKISALLDDLKALRSREPHMHVVVFTQSTAAFSAICQRLRQNDMTVLELSGKTAVKQRHSAIRDFQAAYKRPTVFVVMMKAGNCGITLTSANRVYLMEPCVDPTLEVQAAGRIHRLGQTKHVLVKRMVFRQTYEEQIVKLHSKLKSGQARIMDGKISAAVFGLLTEQWLSAA